MAEPVYVAGDKFKLSLGSGSPNVYTFVCGITSTSINGSRPAKEAPVRDCATPTAGVTLRRKPGVESWEISGDGYYVATAYSTLKTAFSAADSLPWQVTEDISGADWLGKFVITSLNITAPADGQEFATLSITLASDGAVTYSPT